MPAKKLTWVDRRKIALRAIRGEAPYIIADEFGITKQYVYKLRDDAVANASRYLAEADDQLEDRREILDITQSQDWQGSNPRKITTEKE